MLFDRQIDVLTRRHSGDNALEVFGVDGQPLRDDLAGALPHVLEVLGISALLSDILKICYTI